MSVVRPTRRFCACRQSNSCIFRGRLLQVTTGQMYILVRKLLEKLSGESRRFTASHTQIGRPGGPWCVSTQIGLQFAPAHAEICSENACAASDSRSSRVARGRSARAFRARACHSGVFPLARRKPTVQRSNPPCSHATACRATRNAIRQLTSRAPARMARNRAKLQTVTERYGNRA
jgi:hypothetical protein